MAIIKKGHHPLSQQQRQPAEDHTIPAPYKPQAAFLELSTTSTNYAEQSPLEIPTQPAETLPEVGDPFLQSLVWDETTVASGQAPERRGEPRPIRRGEDLRLRERLLEQAKTEAHYIKEVAREAGFQEGLRQAEQSLSGVWDLLENLQTAHQQALANSVEQIVPIAIEIAEKIIKTEVACDKTLLIAIAKDLLSKVDRTQKTIVFKVNPADVALLKDEIERHPSWRMNDRDILVEEDAAVAQGSCVLETAGGQIDANFHTQLKTVRQLLGLPEKAPASNNPLPNAIDDDDDANWGFK
jgi:flagellar assembly protein FliH